jgi:hypothetical protein
VLERFLLGTAILAVLPAIMGNRTAWALLGSYVYACTLERLGVPFWAPLWLVADFMVLVAIASPVMGLADEMIAALFLPSWFAYLCEPVLMYEIAMGAVALQFLLTLPVQKLQKIQGNVTHGSSKQGGMRVI